MHMDDEPTASPLLQHETSNLDSPKPSSSIPNQAPKHLPKQLQRSLGSFQIQLISLGGIIGSAYFLGVSSILKENGPSALIAFLLGGVIAWLVAMAMGELCVGMAREGSFVSHARELVGRPWAAGVGWSYWFNWCAYIPSEMIAGGLILHQYFPQISVIAWASLFAAFVTVINLMQIRHFGHVESGLALLKIAAMALFSILALWILAQVFFGKITGTSGLTGFKGLAESSLVHRPQGAFGFLVTMVLVLVNFQGTELIALSSAETLDPERNIPRAARNVALRTLFLYIMPLALLITIFPWNQATVEHSAFAEALSSYGFIRIAGLFQFVIVTAALSCANSGLYGAVRSLYGLGKEGLAPSWVTQINQHGVPSHATWLTIAVSWTFLPLYILFENSSFYTWLLSVSGFTGAICWISIAWCQIKMRTEMRKDGARDSSLPYTMPGFPYLSWLSIALQTACLLFMGFHPTLRSSLVLGVPAFLLPAWICWLRDRRLAAAKTPSTIHHLHHPHQRNHHHH